VLHRRAYDEAGLRVLIADDDDELRAILAEALRSDGYEVSEARDGAEMLALLNDTLTDPVARPDVIVADGDRVAFEIEDECGGLPPGKTEDLFRPFEQRGTDRSGVGLGLAICLKAAKASGGRIHVRDLPGKGCVFSLDLKRTRSV
jgi:nitrogen fixation/metabolism regulation signal transduction histidine kinase